MSASCYTFPIWRTWITTQQGVYQALTGVGNQAATAQDCMALVLEKVTEKVRQLSATRQKTSGQTYTYVETDFIKALKNGYVAEIQEPSTTSAARRAGGPQLPAGAGGDHHPAHRGGDPPPPDAVVVVTTNVSYEGCRALKPKRGGPDEPGKGHRAAQPGGHGPAGHGGHRGGGTSTKWPRWCRWSATWRTSAGKTVSWTVPWECEAFWTGCSAPRSPGDPYTSALDTVVSKATADPEDREALITSVLDPVFAPGGGRRRKGDGTMARVNHKKVKQLIQERRGEKSADQEFFTSRLLALHFEDIAAAQTKRYGSRRPVRGPLDVGAQRLPRGL